MINTSNLKQRDNIINVIWKVAVFIICYFHSSHSEDSTPICDCTEMFIQDKFCQVHFVFGVYVKATYANNNEITYGIDVENIYKWDAASKVRITSVKSNLCHSSHSCCPKKLYQSHRYVISGFIVNGQLTLDKCKSIIMPTSDVTLVQMAGLSGGYEENCDCVNECIVKGHIECYDKYSYCTVCDKETKRVDMTYSLGAGSVFLPGVGFPFEHTTDFKDFLDVGERKVWVERYNMRLTEHIGTHMDAPSHIRSAPGGKKIDEVPVDMFFGDAVVIDISARALTNPDEVLLVQDILDWEHKYGQIKDGSIVLVKTGWQKFYKNATAFVFGDPKDPKNWHYPSLGGKSTQWLVSNRKIHGMGVDSISIDPGNSRTLISHTTLLEAGLIGIEMVKNLDQIPPSGAKVIALPMKVEGGSGAPTRMVAEFEVKQCRWKESETLRSCSVGGG